jgi:hypothetical protein
MFLTKLRLPHLVQYNTYLWQVAEQVAEDMVEVAVQEVIYPMWRIP